MLCIKSKGVIQMNPLERKKLLKEEFKRKKQKQGKIVPFNEYGIKVNKEILQAYRKRSGGASK